jgi:hypothetical protein
MKAIGQTLGGIGLVVAYVLFAFVILPVVGYFVLLYPIAWICDKLTPAIGTIGVVALLIAWIWVATKST